MSALTATLDVKRKDGDLVSQFMGAVKIYKGGLVSVRADGYLYPARSGTNTDLFAGVAFETIDNSAGSAGATRCRVVKQGTFVYTKTTATVQTDVGLTMYAFDDNNIYATSGNNQAVGKVVELIDSTHLRIRIDTAVN